MPPLTNSPNIPKIYTQLIFSPKFLILDKKTQKDVITNWKSIVNSRCKLKEITLLGSTVKVKKFTKTNRVIWFFYTSDEIK